MKTIQEFLLVLCWVNEVALLAGVVFAFWGGKRTVKLLGCLLIMLFGVIQIATLIARAVLCLLQ